MIDGQEAWVSRSITVLAVLIVAIANQAYVPLGLRGLALPDEIGKWGLPGGYLDYDETAGEAVIREVWEELGLNLLELQTLHQWYGSLEQPYYVSSEPIRKQNVTLRFPLLFILEETCELPKLQPQVPKDEVAQTAWVSLEEALRMDLAFGHQEVIQHGLDGYFKGIWPKD
jgi:8-oxo-dGTP diphosphatase